MRNILLIGLMVLAVPAWGSQQQDANDVISRMTSQLDLQPDQVYHIAPVIQQYSQQLQSLQQSVDSGTMNSDAVASQRQGIEDAETQALSQYLKPYQLSEWRGMQAQMAEAGDSGGSDPGANQYSNLPQNSRDQ